MTVFPLKFRQLPSGELLFSTDAGAFFVSGNAFLKRYATHNLNEADNSFLKRYGFSFESTRDISFTSNAWKWTSRQSIKNSLAYVILVPTLRCDLTCSYCQVSRAPMQANGFDWSPEVEGDVISFLDRLPTSEIKIEFQGGEPTLRLDILTRIREFCRRRFKSSSFVICTNLQKLTPALKEFIGSSDTFVSTSLDGPFSTHNNNRAKDASATTEFYANLDTVLEIAGANRVSALPTIDVDNPPVFSELLTHYAERGFTSIYFRPINYQGFARRVKTRRQSYQSTSALYREFLGALFEHNNSSETPMEEYYLSYCLRRIFDGKTDSHVDLRNPNLFGIDYLVVDFDGRLYPSDEARMLSRVGQVDLSLGDVTKGLDVEKRDRLNASAFNNLDPDCIHCTYQAFCGVDVVDDLSRQNRIDVPRPSTWYCQRHTDIFDLIFSILYGRDQSAQASLCRWLGVSTLSANMLLRYNDTSSR